MKNERVEKSKYLWNEIKVLEERAGRHPDIAVDVMREKCHVADFITPVLLGEIEYYQSMLEKFTMLWQEAYHLERRIDIKNAMDTFDAQFDNIAKKLENQA